jgi:hypothetical protein
LRQLAGGLALGAASLVAGCTPELSNPDRFLSDSGAVCPDVQREILWQRCALDGCHGTDESTGGLEFLTADVHTRLVGVPANTCVGRVLIDPDAPEESFLLERLSEDPRCNGDEIERMPLTGAVLSPEELACVREWVEGLAAAHRASVARGVE